MQTVMEQILVATAAMAEAAIHLVMLEEVQVTDPALKMDIYVSRNKLVRLAAVANTFILH